MNFSKKLLDEYLHKHSNSLTKPIDYGTAGFRDNSSELDSVLFRMGLFASLRSMFTKGTIGAMITASHNPEGDNGIKLVDPSGEMMNSTWEPIATNFANIIDGQVESCLNQIIARFSIDLSTKANIFLGQDTRPSSLSLSEAFIDGVKIFDGHLTNYGVLTTPQLHYMVLCSNCKSYGNHTEDSYYEKLSSAFNALNATVECTPYNPTLHVDGANGVGALKLKELSKYLQFLDVKIYNDGSNGVLNYKCGADFVKTNQKPPESMDIKPGERYASFDGDADRIVYYYVDELSGRFNLLDGDKIAVLITNYLKSLVEDCDLVHLDICCIQTAYSNGASTAYMKDILKIDPVFVPTGVKHLHHRAKQSDISIYFEANGHGTVLFSDAAIDAIAQKAADGIESATALQTLMKMINKATGDALSDLLVVETILRRRGWTVADWNNLYGEWPNTLKKLQVPDRNIFTTADSERKCVTPVGLQDVIDGLILKHGPNSRSFVRPSGTENVLRIYSEAETQEKAEELCNDIMEAVNAISK